MSLTRAGSLDREEDTDVHCDIGSCGVPRPSLAPYVAGTAAAREWPLPEVVRVAYPPILDSRCRTTE